MQTYLTPDELAQHLKVHVDDVLSLIEEGKLRAIRIGNSVRIGEEEVEALHVTCAAVPNGADTVPASPDTEEAPLPNGSRWVATRTGRAKFRVSGSIADGVEIWPGQMRYPIKLPKDFLDNLLAHFSKAGEVPVGGKFDDPGHGSLGDFIKQRLGIKMNPAVYLAALLIAEGYAVEGHRGHLRFLPARQPDDDAGA